MNDMFAVKDRICIVTGGLGQLGTQFSTSLAQAGARVAIYSRRPFGGADLEAKFPGLTDRIRVYVASVTDKAALEAATAELVADWGVPHVLVNNAGIDSKPTGSADQNSPFEIYPKQYWDEIIDTNLTGVMLCCQVVGTRMAEARRGSIINVGSMYGMVSPNQALYAYREKRDGKPFKKAISYAASKAALLNLTRYLGTYWAEAERARESHHLRRRQDGELRPGVRRRFPRARADAPPGRDRRVQRSRPLPGLRCFVVHDRLERRRGRWLHRLVSVFPISRKGRTAASDANR